MFINFFKWYHAESSDSLIDCINHKNKVTVNGKTYCSPIPGNACRSGTSYSRVSNGNECKECPDGTICDKDRQANFELIPGGFYFEDDMNPVNTLPIWKFQRRTIKPNVV